MLSFSSAIGNIFPRLGKLGALVKNAKSSQTTQQPAMIDTTNGVVAQYNGESDIQALMGSSYISQLNAIGGIGSLAAGIAQTTLSRMVFRDQPQLNQNLTSQNVEASIRELIRQMKVAGASVLAMTVTATPGTFTGAGNGQVVASVRRPFDGLVLENSFAETITLTCTQDSYIGGATAGNEGFTVTGTGSQSNVFAFDWPLGSNCNISINAIDGSTDNGSGNILTNSGFESWNSAGTIPSNWDITTGTAGTNIKRNAGVTYDGSYSLELVGDGSTLTAWKQDFNSSSGTPGTLDPLTQYSFCVWIQRDGTAPAAGTLIVELIDGSGAVIQDENGTNNQITIDLTALTTSFAAQYGVFRTPLVMPSSYSIRYRLSVALTNGRSVYLDQGGLGEMSQCYRSGPFVALHSGNTPFEVGDYARLTITNSRGSGGTLSTWQVLFSQFFSLMIQNEYLLPSSSSPSISDNLIQ